MAEYQIFADATADLTESFMGGLPPVEVIPMQVEIGGQGYTYGPGGNLTIAEFYRIQREGNFASTSQINPTVYTQYFEPVLQQGKDILCFCFSSGMSATYQSTQIAAQELESAYPGRKIVCVDTLGATLGEGLLIREAVKMQADGKPLDEVASWVEAHRLEICYGILVDTFDHLKHGGRVSATTAAVGTVLQIKPMLRIDEIGKLEVIGKPRGKKKAFSMLLSKMEDGWCPEVSKNVLVVHGDSPEYAAELSACVMDRFPDAAVEIGDLGPVIGAHTGPGLLALIYWGNAR